MSEDGTGELKQQTEFGATVNGNMLDIAVLEWCKLFADRRAHHYWKRVVRDEKEQQQFLAHLLRDAGMNLQGWKRYLDTMRVYRDKFVAHLDTQNVMNIPSLDGALASVQFLYAYLRATNPASTFEMLHGEPLPQDLTGYYTRCRDEARASYA
ncbi:hypothetical protein ACFQVB_38195 [Paraburkholderia humisilvae]|uniref:hypothetical protein n=1 Tax=Paraburkholderia humisilvae TaxID=627669 RepID=UPI0036100A09